MRTRRTGGLGALFAMLLLTPPLLHAARAQVDAGAERRPNVLFVMSDEHRWQSMSMTELGELRTPNLERLAQAGLSFDRCISNYALCSPFRAMLMTGRWPYQTRMLGSYPGMICNDLPLSPAQPTLAGIFREAGYRTGYVGKWHLGGVELGPFGFDFQRVWTGTDSHWHSFYYVDGQKTLSNAYNATHMVDQVLEFLGTAAERPEPFFLVLSMNPPHKEMGDAPADRLALYQPPPEGQGVALPPRPNQDESATEGSLVRLVREVGEAEAIRRLSERQHPDKARRRVKRVARELAQGLDPRDEERATYLGYHAHISAVDHELGRLLDRLDELALGDDTIVIYTSDHGSMLGSHGLAKKRWPYEEAIRVPFLVRWPGRIPAGVRSEALFGTIDILPTLVRLAGLEVPPECAGLDFSATLLGETGPQPESQFLMNIWDQVLKNDESPYYRGVRTARYTYATTEQGPWLLFDNQDDPYQLKNLVQDESLAEVRAHLAQLTAEWVRVSADPFEPGVDASARGEAR